MSKWVHIKQWWHQLQRSRYVAQKESDFRQHQLKIIWILYPDECLGQHGCPHECVNTQGSYKCACASGFSQVDDQCLGEFVN